MNFPDMLAEAALSTRSDAIIAADKEGIIRFCNPAAERIFGYATATLSAYRWKAALAWLLSRRQER